MDSDAVLTVTDAARDLVLGVRAGEENPDTLALWIEISGVNGNSFTYDMFFQPLADAAPEDVVVGHDDLSVVVRAASVERLVGSTLDVVGGGMVMSNPNSPAPPPRPSPSNRPPADLSGPVAQAVIAVLEEQINPAIAAHGGRADLVAVEGDTAVLRLGGGCQGCGMAAVTLSQGIEVAIVESVPEINRVMDVTDHASGENPYYEAAKK